MKRISLLPGLRFAQYSLLITLRDAGYCTPYTDEKTGVGVTFKAPRANARPRTNALLSVAPGPVFFPLPDAGRPVSSLLCGHQDSAVRSGPACHHPASPTPAQPPHRAVPATLNPVPRGRAGAAFGRPWGGRRGGEGCGSKGHCSGPGGRPT